MTDRRSSQGIQYFLIHLASRVDPVPGFEHISLLGFDQEGTVYLLHLLLFVSVGLYYMARRIFACLEELLYEGLPPAV